MKVHKFNRPLFSLPKSHPARKFLEAFIQCGKECIGREIAAVPEDEIDQKWFSQIDKREWRFSEFAYTYLSFDVVLDGWLNNDVEMTASERRVLDALPRLRTLLSECETTVREEHNIALLPLIFEVRHLLDLWEFCIIVRTGGK
jgi:hypothetical protein